MFVHVIPKLVHYGIYAHDGKRLLRFMQSEMSKFSSLQKLDGLFVRHNLKSIVDYCFSENAYSREQRNRVVNALQNDNYIAIHYGIAGVFSAANLVHVYSVLNQLCDPPFCNVDEDVCNELKKVSEKAFDLSEETFDLLGISEDGRENLKVTNTLREDGIAFVFQQGTDDREVETENRPRKPLFEFEKLFAKCDGDLFRKARLKDITYALGGLCAFDLTKDECELLKNIESTANGCIDNYENEQDSLLSASLGPEESSLMAILDNEERELSTVERRLRRHEDNRGSSERGTLNWI